MTDFKSSLLPKKTFVQKWTYDACGSTLGASRKAFFGRYRIWRFITTDVVATILDVYNHAQPKWY